MSLQVGQLFAKLELDTSGFSSGLTSAGQKLNEFGGRVSSGHAAAQRSTDALGEATHKLRDSFAELVPGGKAVESALNSITSHAGGFGSLMSGIPGLAAAGAGALIGFGAEGVHAFEQLGEETLHFQRVTGASAEEASKLIQVGETLGVSSDTLATAMFRLGKNVEANPAKFKELGVEVARNADGSVNMTHTLENLADAYLKAGRGAEGNALVFQTLGRNGAELIPILERGSAGIRQMTSEYAGLSDAQVEQAERMKIAQRELDLQMKQASITVGSTVVPALTDLLEISAKAAKGSGDLSRETHGVVNAGQLLGYALPIAKVGDLLHQINDLTGGHDKAAEAAQRQADALKETAASLEADKKATQEANKATQEFLKTLDAHASAALKAADGGIHLQEAQLRVTESGHALADQQVKVNEAVARYGPNSNEARDATDRLSQASITQKTALIDLAKAQADLMIAQQETTGATLTQAEKNDILIGKLQGVEATLAPDSPLRSALDGYISQLRSGVPPSVSTQIDAYYKAHLSIDGAGVDAQTGNIASEIGGARALGGPVSAAVPYLVGERGPELFVPGFSGAIVPLSLSRGPAQPSSAAPVANAIDPETKDILRQQLLVLTRILNDQGTLPPSMAAAAVTGR